jgi:hypothetical protein
MADIDGAKAMLKRHEKLKADPQDFEGLLRRVANGETVSEICKSEGLSLWEFNRWVYADQKRSAALSDALATRSEAMRDRIDAELQSIAFADLRDLFTDDHKLKPVSQWPARLGAAVAGLDLEEMFEMVEAASGRGKDKVLAGYLKKLKLWDKPKALEMLGKQHGMFRDKDTKRVADSLEALLDKTWGSNQ